MLINETMIDDFRGDYAFLSNFFESPLWYRGKLWPTVEHAFQAAKMVKKEDEQKIYEAKTPGEAKRLGRTGEMIWDWDANRINVMRKLLQRKFLSNPVLLQKLLNTGDKELIEGNTWHDNYWGDCTCSKCANKNGNNMLGKQLMEIRNNVRHGRYIYAVYTIDNEYGSGSIKEYYKDYKDAETWLTNHTDWYSSTHCAPDDEHLLIIELK